MRDEWLIRYSGSYPNKYRKILFETEIDNDKKINKKRAIELFKALIENLKKEETKGVSVFCTFEVIHQYEEESYINLQILRDRFETKEERDQRLKNEQKGEEERERIELNRLQHKYRGR